MKHDYNLVFDTDNPLWQRVIEIYKANEKYPKKVVSNRNLHHKFPRSFSKKLGEPVDNDKDNLISLSLSDHFLVHYYYYKLARTGYRQPMAMAFALMAKKQLKFISPETAESMAKDYEEACKDRSCSKEQRIKLSKALMGKNKGRVHTQEARNNMSKGKKGKESTKKDKSYSKFGILYLEHFGYGRDTNVKQYTDEYNYYKRHGNECRWQ